MIDSFAESFLPVFPRFLPSGDSHLLIELADDVTLVENVRAICLAGAVEESKKDGILAAVPCFTSVLVHYDPQLSSFLQTVDVCRNLLGEIRSPESMTLPSRHIEIPVLFGDRWTRECYEDYCRTVKPIPPNIEHVAEINNLSGAADVIARVTAQLWWVAGVGFFAGFANLLQLREKYFLSAPKYDPPRLWTPSGTVGLGGASLGIYPIVSPDGYQMLGRTPAPLFDISRRCPLFGDSPVLFRPGDRVTVRSISEDEFADIERRTAEGAYDFSVAPDRYFSIAQFLASEPVRKPREHGETDPGKPVPATRPDKGKHV